jgi:hypothetical protein
MLHFVFHQLAHHIPIAIPNADPNTVPNATSNASLDLAHPTAIDATRLWLGEDASDEGDETMLESKAMAKYSAGQIFGCCRCDCARLAYCCQCHNDMGWGR